MTPRTEQLVGPDGLTVKERIEAKKAASKARRAMQEGRLDPNNIKLNVLQDPGIPYPELWLEVYVVDGGDPSEQRAFAEMFIRSRCTRAQSIDRADLVVFVGGVDVDPQLYGEKAHPANETPDSHRDNTDMAVYLECYEKGIPMFGVCRGLQFIHVMNGGKLYQHVNNHHGGHSIYCRTTPSNGMVIQEVSSVHHQAVIEDKSIGMQVLADSHKTDERWKNDVDMIRGKPSGVYDVEAAWYPGVCALGVQGHPEYSGYNKFRQWCLSQIEHYIVNNPDTYMADHESGIGKYRRLKPEFIKARDELALGKKKELN